MDAGALLFVGDELGLVDAFGAAYSIPGGYGDKFVVGVFVDFKLPARPPVPVVVILI